MNLHDIKNANRKAYNHNHKNHKLLFFIVALFYFAWQPLGFENVLIPPFPVAMAQDTKVDEAKEQSTQANQEINNTKEDEADQSYLAEAGEFSWEKALEDPTVSILVALFLLAVAVSLDRTWYLLRNKGKNAQLVDMIIHDLGKHADKPKELIEKIKHRRYGLEGRIAAKTLEGWNFGDKAMHQFSKAAMESERRGLDKRLVVLSTLGNNTPFIGLLGTVLGIMKAFRDLAMMADAGPSVVMKGISEALIATGFGLAVAIPCVIAFNVFSKIVKAKISNADEIVNLLIGMRLAFAEKGELAVRDYAEDTMHLKKKHKKEKKKEIKKNVNK